MSIHEHKNLFNVIQEAIFFLNHQNYSENEITGNQTEQMKIGRKKGPCYDY